MNHEGPTMTDDDIPRRCQLEHMTPAERAIYDAVGVVEAAGCDVRLTEAVNLLQKARDRVADFVDGVEHPLVSYPKSEPEVLLQVVAEREDWRMREGRAQHEKVLAQKRIKSLEDGIVAENRRTSEIEAELQAVKDLLIARDEEAKVILGAWQAQGFNPNGAATVAEVVARILGERDAADERASTATDVLCGALGPDHGRGGLVEHCQKAADKIKALTKHVNFLIGTECAILAEMPYATARIKALEEDQRATGDVLAGILGRERCEDGNVCLANDVALKVEEAERDFATLAALNKSNAEELVRQMDLRERGVPAPRFTDSRQQAIAEALTGWHELSPTSCPIEGQRVILANEFGDTHECLYTRSHSYAQSRWVKWRAAVSGGSGAAQADVAQRGQSNEGTHGPLDRPASPEPAGVHAIRVAWKALPPREQLRCLLSLVEEWGYYGRALDGANTRPREEDVREALGLPSLTMAWTLAMAQALGTNSGFSVPLVPDVEAFRKLFEQLAEDARKKEWRRLFGDLKEVDVAEANGGYCTTCRLLRRICGGEDAHEKEKTKETAGADAEAAAGPDAGKREGGVGTGSPHAGHERPQVEPPARLTCLRCGGTGRIQQVVSYGEGETQGAYMNESPCPACASQPVATYKTRSVHPGWAEPPKPYTKPKLTELVSREQLVAACKKAGTAYGNVYQTIFEALVKALEDS